MENLQVGYYVVDTRFVPVEMRLNRVDPDNRVNDFEALDLADPEYANLKMVEPWQWRLFNHLSDGLAEGTIRVYATLGEAEEELEIERVALTESMIEASFNSETNQVVVQASDFDGDFCGKCVFRVSATIQSKGLK